MDSSRLFFNPSCNGNMLFLGSGDPVFRGSRSVMNMEETLKRRPFFSSPEELCDEEYYDEQLPEKKRRLTPEQVHWLEKSFETENKLEPERKTELAKKLGLQPRQVAVWFQNRRARWKTKTLERDYDQLKSSYDSLQSNYDEVVKENEELKAEVLSLTEKLQAKEVAGEPGLGQKSEPTAADEVYNVSAPLKVEDRLSTGSGESAVVDEDGRQVVDSGDSYFPNDDDYPGYVTPVDGVGSEEDNGSDNGHKYFPTLFDEAEQQNSVEGESRGWCIWY